MIIEHPSPEPYEVEDFDFQFANGMMLNLSVTKSLGDTIDFQASPLATIFHFAEKPSPTDPDSKLPAEDITVLMQHVISIARRTRLVTPPTFEEKDLFKRTLHKMSRSVN